MPYKVTYLTAPGSWLGFDIINSVMLTSTWTRPWVEMQARAGASDAHYGRWLLPVIPTAQPDMPHNWFVTACKGN